ncbi:MAG: conserved membrane protein of unknown function [Nitrospira sp.]|nr:MAG: conserved membrane protein of unknown function [Nitrospira sp.]
MLPPTQRILLLNIGLGTLVVVIGFWLLWGTFSPWLVALWALLIAVFLYWKCRAIAEVWAWSTLLLGLESFAWPLQLMLQLKSAAVAPSDEEMGTILSAVVLGLFSSVFWMSFSYGLFKRKPEAPAPPAIPSTAEPTTRSSRQKKR